MKKELTNYQNVARRNAVIFISDKYPEMSMQEVADLFSYGLTPQGVHNMIKKDRELPVIEA